MIDPFSFLILILTCVALSHITGMLAPVNRLFWICAPGAALVFLAHPLALAFAFFCFTITTALYLLAWKSNNPRIKTRLPYAIFLLLFVPDIYGILSTNPILWLGSAFFIIRQMMTLASALKEDCPPIRFFPALLCASFFFAALPSGPVFSGLRVWDQLQARHSPDYARGLFRLIEGFAYLFAFAGLAGFAFDWGDRFTNIIATRDAIEAFLIMKLLVLPLLGFAFLFSSFYGYSRLAEGTALLFGFEVPQNFNKPHLAKDLGDFWKRWHRSMADFVMQYIYLPLLVTTGRPRLALISAFTFMGIWHEFSTAFLIWGIGHGLALGYIIPWARKNVSSTLLRVASLIYVVFLSSIAHGVWL